MQGSVRCIDRAESTAALEGQAREQLVLDHLAQIRFIAHRVAAKLPGHVDIDDLISSGVLGLFDAIEKFDPGRDVRFRTYAELRIRGAILDSLRRLDWAPRSLRKKSKDLSRVRKEIEARLGRPATDGEICLEMNLTLRDLYDAVNEINGLNLGHLDESAAADEDGSGRHASRAPDALVPDPLQVVHRSEMRRILQYGVETLPARERLVVALYYYDELTMKEIGRVLGVNESRVSQLHTKALTRLRSKLRAIKSLTGV